MADGAVLRVLGESGKTVADPRADIRGLTVVDSAGEDIGTVEDLLVDDEEERVRFLRVGAGGFLGIGREHLLVPVEAVVDIADERVTVSRERARLGDAPGYDPELAESYDAGYYGALYGWWGFTPFWNPGYIHPGYPASSPRADRHPR